MPLSGGAIAHKFKDLVSELDLFQRDSLHGGDYKFAQIADYLQTPP